MRDEYDRQATAIVDCVAIAGKGDGAPLQVYPGLEERIESGLRHYGNQLDAARYYVHKIRMKMYGDAVARGEMCAEEAMHHYQRSMNNYADVISAAANGSLSEANARQMAEDIEKGFG